MHDKVGLLHMYTYNVYVGIMTAVGVVTNSER